MGTCGCTGVYCGCTGGEQDAGIFRSVAGPSQRPSAGVRGGLDKRQDREFSGQRDGIYGIWIPVSDHIGPPLSPEAAPFPCDPRDGAAHVLFHEGGTLVVHHAARAHARPYHADALALLAEESTV